VISPLAIAVLAVTTIAHVPAGTIVELRPLAPIASYPAAGGAAAVVVLQVQRDVVLGGRTIVAAGALAHGTLLPATAGRALHRFRSAPGAPLLRIDWVTAVSGDRLAVVPGGRAAGASVVVRIREQDTNVPETYDPANR